jgi:uncharacterized protein YggU (UPF0235/DUF167 family)
VEDRNFHFHDGKKGAALAVQLVPRGKKIELVKVRKDGTILIHIPKEYAGDNQVLIDFFARLLTVNEQKINIIAGKDRYEKLISILDHKPADIQRKIFALLP